MSWLRGRKRATRASVVPRPCENHDLFVRLIVFNEFYRRQLLAFGAERQWTSNKSHSLWFLFFFSYAMPLPLLMLLYPIVVIVAVNKSAMGDTGSWWWISVRDGNKSTNYWFCIDALGTGLSQRRMSNGILARNFIDFDITARTK